MLNIVCSITTIHLKAMFRNEGYYAIAVEFRAVTVMFVKFYDNLNPMISRIKLH